MTPAAVHGVVYIVRIRVRCNFNTGIGMSKENVFEELGVKLSKGVVSEPTNVLFVEEVVHMLVLVLRTVVVVYRDPMVKDYHYVVNVRRDRIDSPRGCTDDRR